LPLSHKEEYKEKAREWCNAPFKASNKSKVEYFVPTDTIGTGALLVQLSFAFLRRALV
jgi:hypothetical protein